ncbi:reverse transcriptase domain-containing protein, partial [Tanacetum coccineum]
VCENLLVKINKFIFPVDFVVLEINEDELVPIILGKPFIATAIIDVHKGKLSLRVGSETVTFNIGKSMKSKHSRDDYLYCADHTVKLVQEQWVDTVNHDGEWTEEEEGGDSNEVLAVSFYPRTESVEPLEWKALKNQLKPSRVEPPKHELKELPKHLKYAFLQENNQLPVVISSALSTFEKTRLLEVLRNHKGEIAWSIADIKGIDSSFCTHKILMEDEFKPTVQPQRRVNPNIKEVIPKKGGMTVVKNEKDEFIPQRTVTGWRICIDYHKLNNATWKDHFPLPFIDQMLEHLAGYEYYCFLDGFSRYFQIPIAPEDQEKTTFTCPYEIFSYKRMPFGLCNAPATFQCCMTAIFHELIKDSMEAPIMIKPDWSLPFKIMCDASDYAVGAVLGQRIDKHFKPIHYASKKMNEAQENYTTTKKELLAVICDKKGVENLAADHFCRLENPDLGKLTKAKIRDLFPEERLMAISNKNNEPCVIADHPEDIMASPPPQEKSSRLGFTGHISFAMHVRPFPLLNGNKYVLVAIDYVSKWIEAQAFPTNDARNVVNFLKRLFARFRIPKALISDRGTHFCNHQIEKSMKRYRVVHRFSTAYHPQMNGQIKNTNRVIKHILEKTIRNNRKDWSYKLDNALWAFRTAFKTPLGMTLFRIIYDKACYLPVELEHKAYWAIKNYNMDLTKARENRFLQINELDKMRLDAYESSISYKERTKRWHDKRIKLPINYERGDKVLLFNSCLRLFPGKLKLRWYGPFSVSEDMKTGQLSCTMKKEANLS